VCIQCRPEVGYCILPVSHDLGQVFREFVIGVEVSKMALRVVVVYASLLCSLAPQISAHLVLEVLCFLCQLFII